MQIVKYKTISMRMTDAFDLEKQSPLETKFDFIINSWIESGWQPFGQPYFILDQKWQQINQTMVKYAEPIIPTKEPFVWGVSKPVLPDGIKE